MTSKDRTYQGDYGFNKTAIGAGIVGTILSVVGVCSLVQDSDHYISRTDQPAVVREDTTPRYHGLHPGWDLAITAVGGIAVFGGVYNCTDGDAEA